MSGEHTVQDNTDSTDWATEGRERAEKKGKNRESSILAKPIYFWKPFICTAHRGTLLPKPESCIHTWSRYCLSSGLQCHVSAEEWKSFGPGEVGGMHTASLRMETRALRKMQCTQVSPQDGVSLWSKPQLQWGAAPCLAGENLPTVLYPTTLYHTILLMKPLPA